MVEINHKERFLRAKILYYGPAAGGKTTTLQMLHRLARGDRRQELVSVNTAQDRTILFDLLPLSTPAFRSYELRFQIVAVPGQKFYGATRKMLLKNADSIVFVANSATDRWQENLQSMKEMTEYLLDHGIEPSSLPVVFQYNKRDLPDTTDMKIMERDLNARGAPSLPSVATEGKGVLETFGSGLETTMTELATRYKIGENIGDARSAKEWASKTMEEIFGTTLEELKKSGEVPEPPAEPPPTRVFRVKAPKLSAVAPASSTLEAPSLLGGSNPPVHSPPAGAIELDTKVGERDGRELRRGCVEPGRPHQRAQGANRGPIEARGSVGHDGEQKALRGYAGRDARAARRAGRVPLQNAPVQASLAQPHSPRRETSSKSWAWDSRWIRSKTPRPQAGVRSLKRSSMAQDRCFKSEARPVRWRTRWIARA